MKMRLAWAPIWALIVGFVLLALSCQSVRAQPAAAAQPAEVGRTIEVGRTGFDVKRPVLAAACPFGCPWGELGEFVREAMQPLGYDVILCRNCNRAEGPRIVGDHAYPPALTPLDLVIGTTTRVDAPVDFGVTESGLLASAYAGAGAYAAHGPYKNLRLIAKIEDPTYLLVAVKQDSGITDLAQIKQRRLPVRILAAGAASSAVLDYYGLTREVVASFGGSIGAAMGASPKAEFDVLISDLGTPSQNPESAYWTTFSQKYDLRFLDLPEPLLQTLARLPGEERVTAKWGFLRGVDRAIPTVARSGEAIFARDDMPEAAAYDAAKAIDQHRAGLRWYIRPYSYDPRTVMQNLGVPLHPGAERYYREMGYIGLVK
jgi:TRAP transporter TAXI family solute receptor